MKQNQKLNKLLVVSLVLLFPLVIASVSFRQAAFDLEFYSKEFQQYNPDVNNALAVTKNLLSYLRFPSAGADYISSFNEEETAHLKDVKNLIQAGLWVFYASMISMVILGLLFYSVDKKEFLNKMPVITMSGGLLSLIFLAVFKVFTLNFKDAFVRFHNVFFSQGGWQFPETYSLVRLFPQKFFIDIVNLIVLKVLITAVILIIAGILIIIIKRGMKNG
jgi:integral membrane protein (TIGR01906 family)